MASPCHGFPVSWLPRVMAGGGCPVSWPAQAGHPRFLGRVGRKDVDGRPAPAMTQAATSHDTSGDEPRHEGDDATTEGSGVVILRVVIPARSSFL